MDQGYDGIVDAPTAEIVIPVVDEHLVVGKRVVETGVVRLTRHVEERTELVEIPLTEVRWAVEHVPLDRVVEAVPEVRVEGETTIYPVMEERLVVVRQLVLREEVRVTRVTVTTVEQQSHTLRRDAIVEERIEL